MLYLTGFSDRLFKEKVTLWADEAFLDKPCSVKGLLQAVSLLLFGRFDAAVERTRESLSPVLLPSRRACASRGADPSSADPDRHERAPIAERQAIFGAAVVARAASRRAISAAVRRRDAPRAQRRAQIDAARRVEAQVPHAVGGQPAAVAARGRTARSSTR